MRQPIQVAVYCVRQRGAACEYLLLRRIPSGGGYWQCITGGVEGTEDYFTAARRELLEETGFIADRLERVDYAYSFPVEDNMRPLYERPVNLLTEIVFIALVEGKAPPELDRNEHDAWQWCRYEEALKTLYWSGNRESLRHCERHRRSRWQ